jgi:hypothetical protein
MCSNEFWSGESKFDALGEFHSSGALAVYR